LSGIFGHLRGENSDYIRRPYEADEAAMRAALYLRVSTLDQTTENQERELRAAAERLGHEIVEVYADNGISGSKGRDRRPEFDRLHSAQVRHHHGVVDRPPRSIAAGLGGLPE
jgi:hypothetical protein